MISKPLTWAGAIVGLIAAGLWLWSSRVQPAPLFKPFFTSDKTDAALRARWQKASRLNAWAAASTALATALSSTGSLMGL